MAREFLGELRRDRITEMPLVLDCSLPRQQYYDIYTDSYV